MAQKSPLYDLLNQVNQAAAGGLHLLAISMAVSLPDICSSLIAEDGRTNPKRYKQWCAENMIDEAFSALTPDDLYSMRCGVLHNGRFGDLKHTVARVIFVPPIDGGPIVADGRVGDVYIYSVVAFCANVTTLVYRWYEKNSQDPNVLRNITRLMQYRVGGIDPFFAPVVIA